MSQENTDNSLIKHSKRELKKIKFDQTDIYNNIIEYLTTLSEMTNNDKHSMLAVTELISKCIKRELCSPITEEDFSEEVHYGRTKVKKFKSCTRYPSVYQTQDGRYWDDKAIAYKYQNSSENQRIYLYGSVYNSCAEISLPYFPNPKIVIINNPIQEDI